MRTIHREIVGGFIFSSDDKLLLGKNDDNGVYKDCWLVPGGGIEPGETSLDAVRREILEELSLDVTVGKIQRIGKMHSGQSEKTLKETGERVMVKMDFYNFKISMPMPAEKINTVPGDGFATAKWYSLSELKDVNLSSPTRRSLIDLGLLPA